MELPAGMERGGKPQGISILRHGDGRKNARMSGPVDLVDLARASGGYDASAFLFIGEGLRHAARRSGKDTASDDARHLSAAELVEGVLDLAADRFGLMADLVLRSWGLTRSEDIGRVTFLLIEHGIFSKQPTDRLDDFAGGPEFSAALRVRFQRRLGVAS
jgi:uncharacterized repeat protein (TIGR04138 family)